jgi:predicted ester cyclase
MTTDNKNIIRRYFEEAWNLGHLEILDELIAPNYVNHDPFVPGLPPGPEGLKPIFGGFRTAFSDLHYTIEELVAEGDLVVTRWTMRGTHSGELMGIPPTGRQVLVGGMQIERIVNGQIVEHWRKSDDLGLMQQLGVIAAPQETG